ncbi:hypothetical protein [Anaeroarcus burkinensis]|uniref:hypothetical protein n=1 Tax=Anaeroarcus burkinensis TaxID=82376 RepID=UPI00048736FB|nr:hypothetical protein [Anaeroarcus burkinensis]
MSGKSIKKWLSLSLFCCFLLSTTSLAFAQNNDNQMPPGPPPQGQQMDPSKHIEDKLNSLVAIGTLSEEQSKKIREMFKSKHEKREGAQGMPPMNRTGKPPAGDHQEKMVKELMDVAGLSEEQAKKVAEELRPPKPPANRPQ